jgi:hypothetical protein
MATTFVEPACLEDAFYLGTFSDRIQVAETLKEYLPNSSLPLELNQQLRSWDSTPDGIEHAFRQTMAAYVNARQRASLRRAPLARSTSAQHQQKQQQWKQPQPRSLPALQQQDSGPGFFAGPMPRSSSSSSSSGRKREDRFARFRQKMHPDLFMPRMIVV